MKTQYTITIFKLFIIVICLLPLSSLQSQVKTITGKIENYQSNLAKARVTFNTTEGELLSSKIDANGFFNFSIPQEQSIKIEDFSINPVKKFEIIDRRLGSGEIQIFLSLQAKKENTEEEVSTEGKDEIEEESGADIAKEPEDKSHNKDNNEEKRMDTEEEKELKPKKAIDSNLEIIDELDGTITKIKKHTASFDFAQIQKEFKSLKIILRQKNLSPETKEKIQDRLLQLEQEIKKLIENYKNIHQEVKELAGIQESFMARYSRYLLTMLLALVLFIFVAYYFFVVARREKKRKNKIAEQKEELRQLTEEITSQRDSLATQKTYLEQLQKSKEKLTRSVVHDLKNPLGAVLTSDNFDEIHKAGRRMESYIADMLNIQKYSETGFPITIQNNNLQQIAQSAINTLKPVANKKGVKILNQIEPATFAKFDVKSIERVFENLLSNAIKYTPSGREIIFDATDDTESFVVSVKDTGIGIAKDKFEEIFEPFMQLEARKFADVSSTGIGLTFCKMAVEAHHSKIQVSSNEGQGSEFSFVLEKGQTPDDFVAEDIVITTEEPDLKINLNEEDKMFLKKYVDEIQKIAWFKTKQLSKVIEEIPENNENIKNWKQELLETCENRNKAGFMTLIDISGF